MSHVSDLFDAPLTDTHEALTTLRAESPVCPVTLPGEIPAWLITGYDEVQLALTDPRLSNKLPWSSVGLDANLSPDTIRAVTQNMQALDPPDHDRLRRLVSGAFTTRRINALRPRIEEIASRLALKMASAEQADLIDCFAFPLPMQVICELLGIPMSDRDSFREWSSAAVAATAAPETFAPAVTALVGYVRELLAAKRTEPGDDLLSALIYARQDEDKLSDDELASMVFLLLVAGHETTVNLIGNGTLVLLSQPQRWDKLATEPQLISGAIEEFLRLESPAQTIARFAVEPIELDGQLIPANTVVLVSLLAANRDPQHFAEPDHFDLNRQQPSSHLAFGRGIHFCMGAPLARLEGEIAFQTLLRTFPAMRLAVPTEELRWRPGLTLRGLAKLPVLLR